MGIDLGNEIKEGYSMMPDLLGVKAFPAVNTEELKKLDELLTKEKIVHQYSERPCMGGAQITVPGDEVLGTSWGISVIQNRISYGVRYGLLEIWVKRGKKTKDPDGGLTAEEALQKIKEALPEILPHAAKRSNKKHSKAVLQNE